MGYISGRELYKKNKKIIEILMRMYGVLPAFFRRLFVGMFETKAGKLASLVRYIHYSHCMDSIDGVAYIARYCVIKHPDKIKIGVNFSMHEFSYMDGAGEIEIGDNVSIAHGCSIVSFEHTWSDSDVPIKYCPSVYNKVTICDDVWIGCGVRILSGAKINNRVIIAAGSVVKGELEGNSIYAGVPAKKIKSI